MNVGTAALRGILGPLFVGHGTQKLLGAFGGPGLEATASGFEQMGLRPGKRNAIAAGASEALGGALLTVGALTPLAASMISGTMATAIRKVHAPHGPWITRGGWEYNAVIIGALAALVEHGPGRPSVDDALFPQLRGPLWAVLSVTSGIAGAYVVTEKLGDSPESPSAPQAGAGDPASPGGAVEREPAGAAS